MQLQKLSSLLLLGVLSTSHPVTAQELAPPLGTQRPAAPSAAAAPAAASRPTAVIVDSGSGRLIQLPAPASTILAADPRIARVQPASPTSIFVMGVAAGRTTVIATNDNGQPIAEYDITVRGGPPTLTPVDPNAARAAPSAALVEMAIRRSVPGMASVRVVANGRDAYALIGTVANAADSQRAEAVARATAGENRQDINNLE